MRPPPLRADRLLPQASNAIVDERGEATALRALLPFPAVAAYACGSHRHCRQSKVASAHGNCYLYLQAVAAYAQVLPVRGPTTYCSRIIAMRSYCLHAVVARARPRFYSGVVAADLLSARNRCARLLPLCISVAAAAIVPNDAL
ncbi:hypothetical protein B296_00012558 [Ensete ventricosum]|uniref:Uncharacterized protein n=1 Tax=Ensete ventricosum TaxID=4639 RepID=A0A427AYJ2_ENSVE|nr:hypothetical protein B296_00012558 [Ensete ventricosum]